MNIPALAFAFVASVAIGVAAVKAPCDGGFWTGFKMASGIYCPLPK